MFYMKSIVLTAWAAFFTWFLLSGEMRRYIGPRNYWVIVFGALALAFAAVMHLRLGDRGAPGTRLRLTDGVGLVAVMLPIIVILMVPKPNLGALAASKKGGGIVSATAAVRPPNALEPGGELSLEEVEYASESADYAAAVGIEEGVSVRLIGFVTHPKNAAEGTFALTRFAIFCCAADAIPYSARVIPPPGAQEYPDDTWLEIKGKLAKDADGFFVTASSLETIKEPSDPYLK